MRKLNLRRAGVDRAPVAVYKAAVKKLPLTVGGLAIVLVSFFTTLAALNYRDSLPSNNNQPSIASQQPAAKTRDAIRAEHARVLKEAIDKYIKAHGKYPVLTGDVGELRRALVDGGYLTEIPNDPQEGRRYQYSSNGLGTAYALLFRLEVPSGKIASDGLCLSWPNPGRGETFFGNPPDCPF